MRNTLYPWSLRGLWSVTASLLSSSHDTHAIDCNPAYFSHVYQRIQENQSSRLTMRHQIKDLPCPTEPSEKDPESLLNHSIPNSIDSVLTELRQVKISLDMPQDHDPLVAARRLMASTSQNNQHKLIGLLWNGEIDVSSIVTTIVHWNNPQLSTIVQRLHTQGHLSAHGVSTIDRCLHQEMLEYRDIYRDVQLNPSSRTACFPSDMEEEYLSPQPIAMDDVLNDRVLHVFKNSHLNVLIEPPSRRLTSAITQGTMAAFNDWMRVELNHQHRLLDGFYTLANHFDQLQYTTAPYLYGLSLEPALDLFSSHHLSTDHHNKPLSVVMQDAQLQHTNSQSKWRSITHKFQDQCQAWRDWYAGVEQWIKGKDDRLLKNHQWRHQKGSLSPSWLHKETNGQKEDLQRLLDGIQLIATMNRLSQKMPSSINLMIQTNTRIQLLNPQDQDHWTATYWMDLPHDSVASMFFPAACDMIQRMMSLEDWHNKLISHHHHLTMWLLEKQKSLDEPSFQQLENLLNRILGTWTKPLSLLLWECGLRDQQFINVSSLFQCSLKDMVAATQNRTNVSREEWMHTIQSLDGVLKKMTQHYQNVRNKIKNVIMTSHKFVMEIGKALSVVDAAAQSEVASWYKKHAIHRLQSICLLNADQKKRWSHRQHGGVIHLCQYTHLLKQIYRRINHLMHKNATIDFWFWEYARIIQKDNHQLSSHQGLILSNIMENYRKPVSADHLLSLLTSIETHTNTAADLHKRWMQWRPCLTHHPMDSFGISSIGQWLADYDTVIHQLFEVNSQLNIMHIDINRKKTCVSKRSAHKQLLNMITVEKSYATALRPVVHAVLMHPMPGKTSLSGLSVKANQPIFNAKRLRLLLAHAGKNHAMAKSKRHTPSPTLDPQRKNLLSPGEDLSSVYQQTTLIQENAFSPKPSAGPTEPADLSHTMRLTNSQKNPMAMTISPGKTLKTSSMKTFASGRAGRNIKPSHTTSDSVMAYPVYRHPMRPLRSYQRILTTGSADKWSASKASSGDGMSTSRVSPNMKTSPMAKIPSIMQPADTRPMKPLPPHQRIISTFSPQPWRQALHASSLQVKDPVLLSHVSDTQARRSQQRPTSPMAIMHDVYTTQIAKNRRNMFHVKSTATGIVRQLGQAFASQGGHSASRL